MRPIDADAVLEKAASDLSGKESFGAVFVFSIIKHVIDEQPTIEAQPVRHGRWMNTDETVWDAKEIDGKQQLEISIVSARCSVCNKWAEQVNDFTPYMKYELCPHCGAKMDEGGEDAKID